MTPTVRNDMLVLLLRETLTWLTVLDAGDSVEALRDAIAIGSLFNIVTRYANALDFALPTENEFDRAAGMLLKRGYAS